MQPAVAPAAGGGDPAQPAQGGMFSGLFGTVMRFAIMWAVMTYFKQGGIGTKAPAPAKFTAPPQGVAHGGSSMHQAIMSKGQLVDMYCFITPSPHISYYSNHMDELVWSEKSMPLATGEPRKFSYEYVPTPVSGMHAYEGLKMGGGEGGG
jgi:hypothetical protein